MRKVKLQVQTSVDGFVAGPNGELDWINSDLIDEYHLFVNPVALGSGMTIFGDIEARHNLRLVKAQPFSCGIVGLNYDK